MHENNKKKKNNNNDNEYSKKELIKMFKKVILRPLKDKDGREVGMNGVEALMHQCLAASLNDKVDVKDRLGFSRLLVDLIKFASEESDDKNLF